MNKLFMFLSVVIMFFGIVGWPSSDDPVPKIITSSIVIKSQIVGEGASPVSSSAKLVMLGSGLLGFSKFGRKIFNK